jgi:hypothetical protein
MPAAWVHAKKPVYVLPFKEVFSGAEEFSCRQIVQNPFYASQNAFAQVS